VLVDTIEKSERLSLTRGVSILDGRIFIIISI